MPWECRRVPLKNLSADKAGNKNKHMKQVLITGNGDGSNVFNHGPMVGDTGYLIEGKEEATPMDSAKNLWWACRTNNEQAHG